MRALSLVVVALLSACSSPAKLTVVVPPEAADAVGSFVAFIPGGHVVVQTAADARAALDRGHGARAALVTDLDCGDCFSLEPVGPDTFVVHGGSLLGVQYGLAQLLEDAGFRFYHPRQALVPPWVALPASSADYGQTFTPARALRGLHLHTLHPIEAYFDFWEPSPEHLDGAKRVIDWLVKNRGNYVQWPALDDITTDPAIAAAWHDHTRAILDYAHARGVTVGVGVELFHGGNLQHAYDLLSDADLMAGDTHAVLKQRLGALLGDLPFDRVNLSFGEFFGTSPDVFITQLNNCYDALEALRPGLEMAATVHVGNSPSQHVQYRGMDYLYYFLVQFANPAIVPWIHTVMYYDLFEDAGGAYLHDDFSLHRQYLLDRLQQRQPAAYFPESAYWVAFDDSVPTYLPVYLYTRWLDLKNIDEQSRAMNGGPLGAHVLFSSGWEWGYWQNDYVTLRNTFQTPARWQAPIETMLEPYGARGAAVAAQIEALAQLQHDALIGQRLAPYLAGSDVLLETGYTSGIVSQPHRPSFADVAAMSAADRASYAATVLAPLDQLAAGSDAIRQAVDAIGVPHDDPWLDEIRDGVAVDAARARFIAALYRAAVVHADGGAIDDLLTQADAAMADAARVVAHRHARLHDPSPARLLQEGDNATVYKYGYLNEADTLCYWVRERALARQQLLGSSDAAPGCALGF